MRAMTSSLSIPLTIACLRLAVRFLMRPQLLTRIFSAREEGLFTISTEHLLNASAYPLTQGTMPRLGFAREE
jgi:hypothetical protein